MYSYYKKYVPYLFILPAAVILVLFFFIPFFETVILSFKDYSTDLYSPGFVGLKNYTDLLSSKEYINGFALNNESIILNIQF